MVWRCYFMYCLDIFCAESLVSRPRQTAITLVRSPRMGSALKEYLPSGERNLPHS